MAVASFSEDHKPSLVERLQGWLKRWLKRVKVLNMAVILSVLMAWAAIFGIGVFVRWAVTLVLR